MVFVIDVSIQTLSFSFADLVELSCFRILKEPAVCHTDRHPIIPLDEDCWPVSKVEIFSMFNFC